MAHYIDSEKKQQLKRLEKLGINITGQTFEQAINTVISRLENSLNSDLSSVMSDSDDFPQLRSFCQKIKPVLEQIIKTTDKRTAVCEHPYAYVHSRCNGEIDKCLKCGEILTQTET